MIRLPRCGLKVQLQKSYGVTSLLTNQRPVEFQWMRASYDLPARSEKKGTWPGDKTAPTHDLNLTMKLRMVVGLIFQLLPPSAERLGMHYKVLFMCGAC